LTASNVIQLRISNTVKQPGRYTATSQLVAGWVVLSCVLHQ